MGSILNRRVGLRRSPGRGEEVLLALGVAAGDVGSLVEAVLRRWELTHRQYNVLRMLRGAGAAGLSHADVGDRLLVRAPDVTRLMDRLTDRGVVERRRSPEDRRVVLHRITEEGLELLERVAEPLSRLHRSVAASLGRERAETLVGLCETLIKAVARGDIHAGGPAEETAAGGST